MRNLPNILASFTVSAVLIACGSQSEPAEQGTAEGASAPPQAVENKPERNSGASAQALPDSVARLFSRMDALGPGSQEAYDEELKTFLSSQNPAGTLRSVYRQLPASALGARWKTIHALGRVRSAEAVAILSEVALSPAELSASQPGHDGGDRSFRLRYTASIGVVENLLARVATAEAATERLLGEADREVAQLVGVELFSKGRLSERWKHVLNARGIATNFQRLEGAELEAVRSVGHQTPHQGADVRTRPRMTSVPAIQENE